MIKKTLLLTLQFTMLVCAFATSDLAMEQNKDESGGLRRHLKAKGPKAPKGTKGPKEPKGPKGPKGSKSSKAPKRNRDLTREMDESVDSTSDTLTGGRQLKAKGPKAPKGTKGPKEPKGPKGAKSSKSSKAPKRNRDLSQEMDESVDSPSDTLTRGRQLKAKGPKAPKGTKGPKEPKGPKGAKSSKSSKAPKRNRDLTQEMDESVDLHSDTLTRGRQLKAKGPKAPKGTKGPKEPKGPKGAKSPKSSKAPKRNRDLTQEMDESVDSPSDTLTRGRQLKAKGPKAPKGTKGPKEPKGPKGAKSSKSSKAPKRNRDLTQEMDESVDSPSDTLTRGRQLKAKGPKAPKAPKGTKGPKEPKGIKSSKSSKAPKRNRGLKDMLSHMKLI
jgi:hypothetical protein